MRKIGFLILVISVISNTFAIEGLLIKTIDYSFKEKWGKTLGESIPKISTCDKVFKKQYFYLTAIAADYKLDENEISNVQYSIMITKPDKSVYFNQENLPLVNKKIYNKDYLQMSDAVLKICFEDNDVLGVYKIQIEIIDKNDNKSKKIESEIVLTELPPFNQIKIENESDFSKWFEKYYENPKPESALSYYLFYSQSTLSDNESSFWPVFSIFLEIVQNNNYLLPQFIDCYKTQDLKTKIYLLYLLIYSKIGTDDFYENLDGEEKNTYLDIKDSQMYDIYGTISDPSHLDMLWATFMASGSYKPILKLIQTLEYTKYQGDLDKFKDSQKTEEDRQKAINNAIYDALVWSLKSNCKQHELVLNYCNWAYQYEILTDVQKDELKRIIIK